MDAGREGALVIPNNQEPVIKARKDIVETSGFGALLHQFRETYGERIGANRPGMPRIHLTAQALIACMHEAGYTISPATYSEVESGSLPRDAQKFVNTVSGCLHLSALERRELVLRLSYDILKARIPDLVQEVTLKPAQPD